MDKVAEMNCFLEAANPLPVKKKAAEKDKRNPGSKTKRRKVQVPDLQNTDSVAPDEDPIKLKAPESTSGIFKFNILHDKYVLIIYLIFLADDLIYLLHLQIMQFYNLNFRSLQILLYYIQLQNFTC